MGLGLAVAPGVVIPGADLVVTFSRSGGPGGQNVNKVSSKVTIALDLVRTRALTPSQKLRVRKLAGRRVSQSGILRIVSQETRDQSRNLADARERLRELLAQALPEPAQRRATKVPFRVRQERIVAKRRRGDLKRARRGDES